MLGYVAYRADGLPAAPARVIGGVRFRAVYVRRGEGAAARLSARAAARALRRRGVRCAVFPPDYPHRALFARYGVLPPPLTPLCHALAAGIVRRYATRRALDLRRAAVAFAAPYVTGELRQAVWELSAEIRHIVLSVPGGGELARSLRRERGVAARVAAPGEGVSAGLTVCFEPCGAFGEGAVLPLYEREPRGGAPSAELELYAALFLAGALDVSNEGPFARSRLLDELLERLRPEDGTQESVQ